MSASPERLAAWLDSYRQDLKSALDHAARDGFRVVSANTIDTELDPRAFSGTARRHLSRHLRDLGVSFHALGAEFGGAGLADARHGEERLDRLLQTVQLCRDLGVATATVDVTGLANERSKGLAQEALRRCAEISDSAGVRLCVNGGQESPALLADELRRFAVAGVGATLDSAVFDPHAGDGARLAGMIGGVLLRDVRRTATHVEEVQFGAGQVDFPCVLAALEEAGYAGALTIRRDAPAGVDALRRGREYVTPLVGGAMFR